MSIFSRVWDQFAWRPGDSNRQRRGDAQPVKRLPDYASHYLENLMEEYRILKCTPGFDPQQTAAKVIEETLAKDRLTWSEVFTIERALLRLQDPATIRRRVWALRDRYRVVIGEAAYAEYMKSMPPDPLDPKTDDEAQRADLDQLLAEFHWLYLITPIREGVRNRVSRDIAVGMLVALVVLLVAMFLDARSARETNLSSVLMVFFMGAMGAFLSLQHRIQSIPRSGDAILNILSLKSGWLSVILAPVSGAIFAFILFLAFAAGVVGGSIFPEMYGPAERTANEKRASVAAREGFTSELNARAADEYEETSFVHFLWHAIPSRHLELAKLLLWCFIAGFAERLIPDTLNRMIVRQISVMTNEVPQPTGVVPTPEGDGRPPAARPPAPAARARRTAGPQANHERRAPEDNAGGDRLDWGFMQGGG
jgi:hypothetical protein